MSRPQVLWSYAAAVVTVLGLTLAVLLLPMGMVIAVAIMAAIGAGTTLSLLPGPSTPSPTGRVVSATAALAVAVPGLATAAGAVGLLVVAVLTALSPPAAGAARYLYHRYFADVPNQPTSSSEQHLIEQIPAVPTDYQRQSHHDEPRRQGRARWDTTELAAVPDADLCLAWRASYTALQRCPDPDRAALVAFRAAVLDELQARHPAAFTAWINAGARAASDPARYLPAQPEEQSGNHRPDRGHQPH